MCLQKKTVLCFHVGTILSQLEVPDFFELLKLESRGFRLKCLYFLFLIPTAKVDPQNSALAQISPLKKGILLSHYFIIPYLFYIIII